MEASGRRHIGTLIEWVIIGILGLGCFSLMVAGAVLGAREVEKSLSFCEQYDECSEEKMPPEIIEIEPLRENSGVIYLTFDDGPSEYTGQLLDTLARYGVKATFFVTGRGKDELILREYREGHTVGLHTDSHNYAYIYANADNYFEDLLAVSQRVEGILGQSVKLIRFPGGSSNTVSRRYDRGTHIMSYLAQATQERGYRYFDWNVDSDDAGGARSADEVYENVVNRLRDDTESIVLQHDVKKYSVDAVENIIRYGLENGFEFKKLELNSFSAHHDVNN